MMIYKFHIGKFIWDAIPDEKEQGNFVLFYNLYYGGFKINEKNTRSLTHTTI